MIIPDVADALPYRDVDSGWDSFTDPGLRSAGEAHEQLVTRRLITVTIKWAGVSQRRQLALATVAARPCLVRFNTKAFQQTNSERAAAEDQS